MICGRLSPVSGAVDRTPVRLSWPLSRVFSLPCRGFSAARACLGGGAVPPPFSFLGSITMAWDWSHTAQAYADARDNMAGLDDETVASIAAEWRAATADEYGNFDLNSERFDAELATVRALIVGGLRESVEDEIWSRACDLATCTNGGHYAWLCPFGCSCHMVGFSPDPPCECADPGCGHAPFHRESDGCSCRGTVSLVRIDLADESSMSFCEDCASDALASGLFCEVGEDGGIEPPSRLFYRYALSEAIAKHRRTMKWARADLEFDPSDGGALESAQESVAFLRRLIRSRPSALPAGGGL